MAARPTITVPERRAHRFELGSGERSEGVADEGTNLQEREKRKGLAWSVFKRVLSNRAMLGQDGLIDQFGIYVPLSLVAFGAITGWTELYLILFDNYLLITRRETQAGGDPNEEEDQRYAVVSRVSIRYISFVWLAYLALLR